jgi:SPP1 family predicted phage head-tail adaptor
MGVRIYSAGELNQRIQIQAKGALRNSLNEPTAAWQDQGGPIWAKAEPLTGRELLAAGAMQQPVNIRFVIRHRDTVKPGQRVIWKGQGYDIESALPVDGGREWTEVMARTAVRDGQ